MRGEGQGGLCDSTAALQRPGHDGPAPRRRSRTARRRARVDRLRGDTIAGPAGPRRAPTIPGAPGRAQHRLGAGLARTGPVSAGSGGALRGKEPRASDGSRGHSLGVAGPLPPEGDGPDPGPGPDRTRVPNKLLGL